MKTFNYGSIERAEQELKIAQLTHKLIYEAITCRLTQDKLCASDLAIHAEILDKAESFIDYVERELSEAQGKEGKDNE